MPGPKKGQIHAGSIKPGEVRNPGGRPKTVGYVRELASQQTEAAIKTLTEICSNEEYPPAARVTAANSLLDRAYGRPESTSTVNIQRTARELTTDELVQIISGAGAVQPENGASVATGLH